jgi:hypothetical protein
MFLINFPNANFIEKHQSPYYRKREREFTETMRSVQSLDALNKPQIRDKVKN